MKTIVTVRKIPLEDVLNILLEMRELGIEHVNFKCEMTPTKDSIHVIEYRAKTDPNQQIKLINSELKKIDHMEYIQKIIDNHGKN